MLDCSSSENINRQKGICDSLLMYSRHLKNIYSNMICLGRSKSNCILVYTALEFVLHLTKQRRNDISVCFLYFFFRIRGFGNLMYITLKFTVTIYMPMCANT